MREKKERRTRETDGTDEADVDYIFVAEAGCTEIYLVLGWDGEYFANRGRWEKRHLGRVSECREGSDVTYDKILEQGITALEMNV